MKKLLPTLFLSAFSVLLAFQIAPRALADMPGNVREECPPEYNCYQEGPFILSKTLKPQYSIGFMLVPLSSLVIIGGIVHMRRKKNKALPSTQGTSTTPEQPKTP